MSRDDTGDRGLRPSPAAVGLISLVLIVLGVLVGLHLVQTSERDAQSAELSAFRTARLDVAEGIAHVTSARTDGDPLERAHGTALVRQGLDELEQTESARRTPELEERIDATRTALDEVAPSVVDGPVPVALRVAFGHLESVAGRIDDEAALHLARTSAEQDTTFSTTMLVACALFAIAALVAWRSSHRLDRAEAARAAAERESSASDARERQTAAMFRAVVDGTTDAVFVKDNEGRYRLLNDATARVFGRRIEEVVGANDAELWDAASAAIIAEQDARVLREGVASTHEEVLTVQGTTHTFLATKAPWRGADGGVLGLIGISRDVTERVRMETQLRQAQKMEAIGRLAGGVAHDFNNLLTVIGSCAELLADAPLTEPQREAVDEIREAGERAGSLTAQLLAFSRKAIVAPRPTDLNEAVKRSERLLRRLIGEDVVVSTRTCTPPCVVEMDPAQLDQVLLNLGANARDAMPRGGRLEIETAVVNEAEGEHAGRWAELCVSDSGAGMSDEVRAHIFEPFFTTKALGLGTGLGLSVIDGIVAQAGGHVLVESRRGRGTTFRVRLPLSASQQKHARGVRPPDARGVGSILLVEDDDAVRRISAAALRTRGYDVHVAGDGEAAFATATDMPTIDLLVTDVVMPGASGRELVDRLRAIRPDLRVLYVTGYTDDAVVRHGVSSGGDPILPKPFTPTMLAQRVAALLEAREPRRAP